jgi:hypothetical protein
MPDGHSMRSVSMIVASPRPMWASRLPPEFHRRHQGTTAIRKNTDRPRDGTLPLQDVVDSVAVTSPENPIQSGAVMLPSAVTRYRLPGTLDHVSLMRPGSSSSTE